MYGVQQGEVGSPPRMRGKLFFAQKRVDTHRITPADAGKTKRKPRHYVESKDHPRGCGENSDYVKNEVRKIGSPPRMRGKRDAVAALEGGKRITPADAGKTVRMSLLLCTLPDHPRGCGENFPVAFSRKCPKGSPPRMRGKHERHGIACEGTGITPADAGKTLFMSVHTPIPQDHPRGCGENRTDFRAYTAFQGSPPRMRGKPSLPFLVRPQYRITPADAGKTSGKKIKCGLAKDHPRGCGENNA